MTPEAFEKRLEQLEKALAIQGRVLLEVQHSAAQLAKLLQAELTKQPGQLERIASHAPTLEEILHEVETLRLARPLPSNV